MERPMSKSIKNSKIVSRPKNYYCLQPWKAQHYPDRSEITAYVEMSGQWETVLVLVRPTSGFGAEEMASHITAVMNNHQKGQNLLHDAMQALEAVLKDGLTFSTEQTAEHVVTHIKKVM